MTPLERGYRRLLACYPKSFRRENEEEIVAVLIATSCSGQLRPSLAESADLLKGAVRMHLGLSRAPRCVVHAVRLMCLGAAAELGVLITMLVTAASIQAAAVHHYPQFAAAVTRLVNFDITVNLVVLPVAILAWLWVAWGNGRGSQWARLAALGAASLNTVGMIANLAQGTMVVAPAVMIISGLPWALGVAAVACMLRKPSWPYYEKTQARPQQARL